MPPAYPRPYGRGISRAAPRMFFWKKRAPPRTHITVAIHPRAYARGILAHTSKCDALEIKNRLERSGGKKTKEHLQRSFVGYITRSIQSSLR